MLFNVLKKFHSPGGARPQYLNKRSNPIFAVSTFKNTIPTLDRYTRADVGTSIATDMQILTYAGSPALATQVSVML